MTIKQLGGVFGRNPTFNDVTIDGTLTFDGDIDISSDLKISGDLEVTGTSELDGNVAIGAGVTPTYPLTVEKDSDSWIAKIENIGSDADAQALLVRSGATAAHNAVIIGGYADGAYKMLLRSSGNLELLAGNLVIGTSGKGIDFSATAGPNPPASGTSELLDDYEEGTWTPAFLFDIGGTGIVYGTRSGKYTKIGNTVCVDFELNVASGISVADYFVRLSGIPFNCANDGLNIGRVWIQNPNSASFNLSVQGGSDSLICFTDNAASGAGSYARGDDVVGVTISGSFTYRTS